MKEVTKEIEVPVIIQKVKEKEVVKEVVKEVEVPVIIYKPEQEEKKESTAQKTVAEPA